MKSYDEAVDDMLCFLKSKDVCLSSINSHRDCYQRFELFMHEHEKQWEPTVVSGIGLKAYMRPLTPV